MFNRLEDDTSETGYMEAKRTMCPDISQSDCFCLEGSTSKVVPSRHITL